METEKNNSQSKGMKWLYEENDIFITVYFPDQTKLSYGTTFTQNPNFLLLEHGCENHGEIFLRTKTSKIYYQCLPYSMIIRRKQKPIK